MHKTVIEMTKKHEYNQSEQKERILSQYAALQCTCFDSWRNALRISICVADGGSPSTS